MDEVADAVAKVIREWDQIFLQTRESVNEIANCGVSGKGTEEVNALPRLNRAAQDGLAVLRSLIFKLDLLAPQLLSLEEIESSHGILEEWKEKCQSLHASLRNANLQAKSNIRKSAQEERELLLGSGEESTVRRRNLQTKAGMINAAESVTESLRRSRQLLFQEVDRSVNTTATFDFEKPFFCKEESTIVLKRAESEFKGHRSLLARTRHLLATMKRQDVLDRVILVVGSLIFTLLALYVVSKRIGLLRLQRTVTAVVRSGMIGAHDIAQGLRILGNVDGLNNEIVAPQPDFEAHVHDEL